MTSKINFTIKNNIGSITLNNPEKSNALDVEMRDTLIKTYLDFDKDPTVKIIILNGNGKNFCAGADLNHMKKMSTVSYDENLQDAKKLAELFYTIYSCEKPTICFAHGKTIGGGLGLLAASDIAIAAPDAGFCFSEVKIGLIPAVISPFVTQRIGYQAAKYEMMTAELFDSQKALKIGLIDKVDQDAMGFAEIMLANSQHAMQEIKAWLNKLKPITQEQVNQAAELLASIRAANR